MIRIAVIVVLVLAVAVFGSAKSILRRVLLAAILTLFSSLSPWPNISGSAESLSINRPPRPLINNLGLPLGYIRVVNGTIEKIHWKPAATDLACWFILITSVAIFQDQIRKRRNSRMRRAGLCIKCGYNLEGNVSGVCSECGERC